MKKLSEIVGFTEGPWEADNSYMDYVHANNEVDVVAYDIDSEENRVLIAAAPEMLEALVEIYIQTYSKRTKNITTMLSYQHVKGAIESATNIKWEELRKEMENG